MKTRLANSLIIAASFVILIITGIILHTNGLPFKPGMITIHKLASLAFIIIALIWVRKSRANIKKLIAGLFVLLGVTALAAIVSGGIISHKQIVGDLLNLIHLASSALFVLLSVLLGILLLRSKSTG